MCCWTLLLPIPELTVLGSLRHTSAFREWRIDTATVGAVAVVIYRPTNCVTRGCALRGWAASCGNDYGTTGVRESTGALTSNGVPAGWRSGPLSGRVTHPIRVVQETRAAG